jgi:GTP diphosphokinase / guanosine-3',5'-bis(diphosphate) 3'-diphosphatase
MLGEATTKVISPYTENERLEIQRAYRNLLKSVKVDLTQEDLHNIRKAYELAVDAHAPQRRKSGEAYIFHPIEVARICAEEIGLGATGIICALLHDVVEDTEIGLNDIKEGFGAHIAMIVDGLTKLDAAYDTATPQAENFKKVLTTLTKDVRVVLIKMADRLHNMRTLGAMPRHKQLKIAAETEFIYAPLAHRLGLYNVKTEYQDLCMKIKEPEHYFEIAKKLQDNKRSREQYVELFINNLIEDLEDMGVPYRIFGRPKSIYSIWNKIKTKNVPFEDIYDLFAIRIVFDVPRKRERTVCFQAYAIVTDVYKAIPERFKDWISAPKSNGYESLHTTVIGPEGRFVEVQIRSERMDEIAERGFAAHWKYKGVNDGTNQQNVYENWLDNVRELLENNSGDALEFIQDFKTNLYQDEVHVYTPKGDLIVLPKGATGLDFAFSIHSQVGAQCSGVKVDDRLVPMGYQLKDGERVSVLTNKNQKPTEDWLKIVVTGKARAKIRQLLKEEKKRQSIIGKETLQRKFEQLNVDFETNVDMLARHLRCPNRLDLYYALSLGHLNLTQELKKFKVDGNKLIEIEPIEKVVIEQPNKAKSTPAKLIKPRLLINGQSGDIYEYTMATCCNPVPGDSVFAYLTSGAGLRIHRVSCPNATNLMANYGYRVLKADWVDTPTANFVANIKIIGIDTGVGVIEKISASIAHLGISMRSFHIDGHEGYFEAAIAIVVMNIDQLNMVIRKLKELEGVQNAFREE